MQMSEAQYQMMMRMAISEVFQKMFFLICEEINLEPKEKAYSSYVILTHKESKLTSYLCLTIEKELLRVMTENFLGIEADEVKESDCESTILEILNMVAGNFLNQIDPNSEYQLGIPQKDNPQICNSHGLKEEFQFDGSRVVLSYCGL